MDIPLKIKISEKLLGLPFSKYLKEFNENEKKSIEFHSKFKSNALFRILKYSEDSPYYRNIIKKNKIEINKEKTEEIFLNFPIVNKHIIKNNYHMFNNQYHNFRKYATGGSTGEPFEYFVNKNHLAKTTAALFYLWGMGNWKFGEKMITIAGTSIYKKPKSVKEKLYLGLREWLEDNTKLSSFDLNPIDIKKTLNVVQNSSASILRVMPSGIEEIIRFMKSNGYAPKRYNSIFTATEQLHPYQRELIEEYFNVKVYDQYGARDGGGMAGQCEIGNYHILPTAYWEILDNENQRVVPGEQGELTLTDYYNKSSLFIRYQVGDRVSLYDYDDICNCGRTYPLIKKIHGRSHDIIRTNSGDAVQGEFFTHIFRYEFSFVNQFQVVQKSLEKLEIYVVNKSKTTLDKMKLENIIKARLSNIEIIIFEVDEIDTSISGKRRFIIGL